MRRLLLGITLGVLLAACGSKESAPVAAPAAEQAATPEGATSAGTPSEAELKEAASATQESAGEDAGSAGDATLERMVAMPESAQLPGGRWKAGTNYIPIVPAQGTSVDAGKVEVLEILWLGCPHCYEAQPFVAAWESKKPDYIQFTQEHVMWGPIHRAHGRLFYTLEVMGRHDLVAKAFEQIHLRSNALVAANDAQTVQMHQAFAKANGLDEAQFRREYNGFTVNTRLQRAEELMRRYQIDSVPTFIVNGKYRTDVGMAGGHEKLPQLLNDLAAAEKRR